MNWKEFLKPDLRKIFIVLIFLLSISLLSLTLISKFFANISFRFIVQAMSSHEAFLLCTNTTTQNITNVRECYSNELVKTGLLLDEISKEIENDKIYFSILQIIYPGINRLAPPLSNCLLLNYIKYVPKLENITTHSFSQIFSSLIDTSNVSMCYYQTIFEIVLMFVYFYLLSCLIFWIYYKVKKNDFLWVQIPLPHQFAQHFKTDLVLSHFLITKNLC